MAERRQDQGEVSLVGSGTSIEGKIRTEGSIRIDGTVVGEVTVKLNAAIGEGGAVEGTVVGKSISVAGRVKGTVAASDKLVLEAKSVVRGEIRATRLVVDEGAIFDGQCAMSSQSDRSAGDKRGPTPLSVAPRPGTQAQS